MSYSIQSSRIHQLPSISIMTEEDVRRSITEAEEQIKQELEGFKELADNLCRILSVKSYDDIIPTIGDLQEKIALYKQKLDWHEAACDAGRLAPDTQSMIKQVSELTIENGKLRRELREKCDLCARHV